MARRSILATYASFANELRLLRRDPYCGAILLFFSFGLAWSSWTSYQTWRHVRVQQEQLQSAAREAWLSQTTANAHMATHVGQTVYKPVAPLTGFDPGAVASYGSQLLLKSHLQHVATNIRRYDEIDLLQNESYSPSVLLELIGPLLIISLGHVSVAREKEGGTLTMLLATGSSWSSIVIGKSLAILLAIYVVATPSFLLLMRVWWDSHDELDAHDLLAREVAIFITLTAYYVGWLGLAIVISSLWKSSIGSFSLLIALWSIVGLVAPRLSAEIATLISPIPTNADVRRAKEEALHQASQSSVEKAKANKALETRLMKEYGVERPEDLPIDIAGARMLEQELNTNRSYDAVDRQIKRLADRQDEVVGWLQLVSPYLAMRSSSASLSATSRLHHFDFLMAAENYRRQFVEEMNLAEMSKQKPGTSPGERRQFWSRVPAFAPRTVTIWEDLKRSMVATICIFVWGTMMSVAAFLVVPQVTRTG